MRLVWFLCVNTNAGWRSLGSLALTVKSDGSYRESIPRLTMSLISHSAVFPLAVKDPHNLDTTAQDADTQPSGRYKNTHFTSLQKYTHVIPIISTRVRENQTHASLSSLR